MKHIQINLINKSSRLYNFINDIVQLSKKKKVASTILKTEKKTVGGEEDSLLSF